MYQAANIENNINHIFHHVLIMFVFIKDNSRIEGSIGIAFSATKHEVHTNIKPGTSASSVSSYGSLGQRVSWIIKNNLFNWDGYFNNLILILNS